MGGCVRVVHIEQGSGVFRSLECMTEWKYCNDLGHHPRKKASLPVSQRLPDGIDMVQPDPANAAKINNFDVILGGRDALPGGTGKRLNRVGTVLSGRRPSRRTGWSLRPNRANYAEMQKS